MAVDGGVLTVPVTAGVLTGTFLVGVGYGVYKALESIKENERLEGMLNENADRAKNLISAPLVYPQLPRTRAADGSQQGAASSIQAVWEAQGKELVLKLGAAIVLTFSATHLQAMELKPAARLIHQQVAEHYPDADVSFSNCKFAAVELGKQGGLKNSIEDLR